MMIDANAAITLLEKRAEKKTPGFEWDSNPRPLRYRCNKLSKPHESGRVWVGRQELLQAASFISPFVFGSLKCLICFLR